MDSLLTDEERDTAIRVGYLNGYSNEENIATAQDHKTKQKLVEWLSSYYRFDLSTSVHPTFRMPQLDWQALKEEVEGG